MFTDDPKPQPQQPPQPTDKKDTAPDKGKPPHQFDDWASI